MQNVGLPRKQFWKHWKNVFPNKYVEFYKVFTCIHRCAIVSISLNYTVYIYSRGARHYWIIESMIV